MDKALIIERIGSIVRQVAGPGEIELVHIDISGTKRDLVVRIFVDKEGGVTLDDCSTVSRDVEAVLDADDFIPTRYVLEVSSPGIERQLYSLADFQRFTGKLAKVKTKVEIEGQKIFVGPISAVEGDTITLEDRTRGTVKFGYADVEKANLKIDLSQEFRGR